MNISKLQELATQARANEDIIDRLRSTMGMWLEHGSFKYQAMSKAVTTLAEVRFFMTWLRDAPDEKHLAVERLVSFLTEGEIPEANAGGPGMVDRLAKVVRGLLEHEGRRTTNGIGLESDTDELEAVKKQAEAVLEELNGGKPATNDTVMASLCEVWERFCRDIGVTCESAEEIIYEAAHGNLDLTFEQRKFAHQFLSLWNAWEDLERAGATKN